MKLALAAAAAAALSCALIALPDAAAAKPARCAIASAGNPAYRGPCEFLPEAGGSFALNPAGGRRALVGGITSISVFITEPGVAQVSGLTRDGISSRWGEARRARKDRACWDGADFRICVY
jgi:hypothetical protein